MAVEMGIYKCEVCGNIVENIHNGGGTLSCCDQPMNLNEENSTDAAQEKHVPVIEKTGNGYKVTVGSVSHPMEDNHYIMLIELIAGGKVYRQNLKPGDAPVAEFCVDAASASTRAYCNLHGLWKA
ncbi:desulfoferrodoxin [Candidatus Latescibacterota bacterium]